MKIKNWCYHMLLLEVLYYIIRNCGKVICLHYLGENHQIHTCNIVFEQMEHKFHYWVLHSCYVLRVEIAKLISVIGIIIFKGLLVVVTYCLLPKDEINGIS